MELSITNLRILAAATGAGVATLLATFGTMDRVDAHTRITTNVNWSESIRPIFIQKCMPCHHPGGVAPDYVDLTFYGTDTIPGARAWADGAEDEIMLGRMPPWNADERFGNFSNSRGLTKEEKELILSWIGGGKPQGPFRNLPAPEEFARPTWTFGQPDVIVGLPQGHVVPAKQMYDTVEATLAVNIEKDTYITGYEFLVGDPKNVWRVTAWLHDPDGFVPQPIEMEVTEPYDPYKSSEAPDKTHMRAMPRGPHFLGQWVKGDGPVLFPDTAGRRIYAGSSIQLRIEYVRPEYGDFEKEIRDNTQLGLFLGAPTEEFDLLVESRFIESEPFVVAAQAKEQRKLEYTFEENVHLLGIEPHLGSVTKQVKIELFYPDGIQRTLVWVPRYQHRWATSYRFAEPVGAPAGTRVVITGTYDNTADNPENPNSPPVDVKSGPGYLDERLHAYLHYHLDDHLKLQPLPVVTQNAPQQGNGGMLGGLGDDILQAAGGTRSVEATTAQIAQTLETSTEPERVRIASNGYHQLQGVMRRPGAFSLYVFDDRMEPLDPRNFAGDVVLDNGARTVPLARFAPGDDFLSAWLDPTFPQTFEAKIKLGGVEEKFEFKFDAPSPDTHAAPQEPANTAFVQPPHGGWLEDIEGTGYQVEAALPANGDFRLYFYGPEMKPVDPRNFRGDVEIIPTQESAIKSVARLGHPSPRADYLSAKVSPELPLKLKVSLAIGNGKRDIEFEFDEKTEAPWDPAEDAAPAQPVILGPHGSPELYASANGFNFLEAALPRPGELRLYFYDAWKNLVDPGLFNGEIEAGGVKKLLARSAKNDEYLTAFLSPQMPLKANATLWIAGKEEKFKFNFTDTTLDPNQPRDVAAAHMNHEPLHGGTFFMVDNVYHHVECTLPAPGELRVYFYDDFKRPLDPRNFSGSARIEHLNEQSGAVTEDVFPLELLRAGDGFLTAKIPASMPAELYALINFAGVDKRFDLQFDQVTIDTGGPKAMPGMPGMAMPGAAPTDPLLHTHIRPPFAIPTTLEGILAALDAKRDDLRKRIETKDFYTLYQPAWDIADLIAALSKLDVGVDARQKGQLAMMQRPINLAKNKIDRAGDTNDIPRMESGFDEIAGIIQKIHSMFPAKK